MKHQIFGVMNGVTLFILHQIWLDDRIFSAPLKIRLHQILCFIGVYGLSGSNGSIYMFKL